MSACVKKLKIYERDGSRSSTLRGRGNSRSQKRKIPVDNAIRVKYRISRYGWFIIA